MTEIHTLRPGLLVALSTSIKGNIAYRTLQLETTHIDDSGQERARWETERVISDPAEHEAAVKLRSKVRGLIVSVCSQSAFGLLAPEADLDKLTAAIADARALVEEFNSTATLTRVQFNIIYGRIAADDVEAVKAISAELRNLMEEMQTGLSKLDVKVVRDAASKAKAVGEMLTPEAQSRLEVAITAARSAARKITAAGDVAALEIDRAAIAKIDMARTSFLDLDTEVAVATPVMDGRSIDLMEVS